MKPEDFTASLDRIVRDGPLREAMGAGGRAYVRGRYAWDAVLARYATLIDAAAG